MLKMTHSTHDLWQYLNLFRLIDQLID